MRQPHRILSAVGLVLLLGSGSASAASCPFQHPASAKGIKASLVQAFVSCGGEFTGDAEPNATTEGGVPSCYPVQTMNERAGSPQNGWLYGPKGHGTFAMKVRANDIAITLKLDNIMSALGPPDGTGRLQMLLRITLADPAGPMTIIEYPVSVHVDVARGKARLKTTINTLLSGPPFSLAPFPPCTNIELVFAQVIDENFTPFAVMGVFLP